MRNWMAAAVAIILAAFFCIIVLSTITAKMRNQLDEVAKAEIAAEEQERHDPRKASERTDRLIWDL